MAEVGDRPEECVAEVRGRPRGGAMVGALPSPVTAHVRRRPTLRGYPTVTDHNTTPHTPSLVPANVATPFGAAGLGWEATPVHRGTSS